MKSITSKEYITKFPFDNQEYYENLTLEQQNTYLFLLSVYNDFLYKYLINKLKLNSFDEVLLKSKNSFIKIKEEEMDIYQYFSSDYLSYFYIRNNLYIERLTKEEMDYLYNCFEKNDMNYDTNKERFIESTIKKVLLEEPNITNHKKNYGPNSHKYYLNTNSIILGFRYNEFAKSSLSQSDEEWEKLHFARIGELNKLIASMEQWFKSNLDISVNIVKYSDFSVICKKKITNMSKR